MLAFKNKFREETFAINLIVNVFILFTRFHISSLLILLLKKIKFIRVA